MNTLCSSLSSATRSRTSSNDSRLIHTAKDAIVQEEPRVMNKVKTVAGQRGGVQKQENPETRNCRNVQKSPEADLETNEESS